VSFYSELASTADEILREFGSVGLLSRVTPGAYDPATGTSTPATTTVSVIAAVFDYDTAAADGSLILQGDKQVFMSAVGITPPAAGDILTWQTVAYTVIAVKPLAPAGVDTLHELQVRK
jgi:hypothetical protein